ncbi:MAG: thioester domain-containing protein [Isosphaeraceae bacterium]
MESLEQRTLLTTGVLVLPDTTSPPSFGATVNVTEFGNTLNTTSDFNTSGGNFLGTFNGNQLSATYCLNLTLGISPPEEFDSANETTDGTIYGTPVPNAGAISWLLTNIGPTVTTLDQEAALQAAIWRTEYGPNGFQVNSVDNSDTTDTTGEEAIMQPFYQSYLQALGKNTAPVSSVDWISPDEDGMDQGLVALPTITAAPLTLGNLNSTQGTVNQKYTGKIAVSGGSGSYMPPTITGLPKGLVYGLAGKTITVSGIMPTQSGQFNNIKVSLRDSNGASVNGVYSLTVNPAPAASVTVSAPSTVTEGIGFQITITVKDKYGNGCTGPVTLSCAGPGLINPEQVSPTTVNVVNVNGTVTFTVKLASQAWSIKLNATAGKVTGSSKTIIVLPPTLQWPSRYANFSSDRLLQPTQAEIQEDAKPTNPNENPGVLWIVNGTNPEKSSTPASQMCYQFAFGPGPLWVLNLAKYQLAGPKQGSPQPQIGDIGLVFVHGVLLHACIVVGRDSHGNWLFAQRNGVSPVFIGNMALLVSEAGGPANTNNIRFVPGN